MKKEMTKPMSKPTSVMMKKESMKNGGKVKKSY